MEDLRELSDASLVVLVARHRHDALAEVFRRHGGSVQRLAQRILGDALGGEEVVQDVFINLWSSPERFDPGRGSLRSFLLMRAHTRSVDLLRSDHARREREAKDARQSAPPAESFDVERQVWDFAIADRVQVALRSLSDGERRAIDLAYFGGYTYRDVAQMLGEPEGTVKSRIRSGLKALRRELGDLAVIGASHE